MNGSRDFGGGRRRRPRDSWGEPQFDEGAYQPAPSFNRPAGRPPARTRQGDSVPAERSSVTARVKWYNAQKGFGFVTPEGEPTDAFLHVSVLERAGGGELHEGDTIVCDLGRGQRGPQVVAIHSVDHSTGAPAAGGYGARGGYAERPQQSDRAPGESVQGTVKWFNPEKGFGFIVPDDGGRDVFVHITAVRRAGLETLEPGDRVSVTTQIGRKGPEVDSLTVI